MICQNNPIVLTNFDKFLDQRNDAAIMAEETETKLPEATLPEFFESKPLNQVFRITGVTFRPLKPISPSSAGGMLTMPPKGSIAEIPAIRLWCHSDQCDGFRNFDPIDSDDELRVYDDEEEARDEFVVFVCRNCRRSTKKYAISY
jgi:hypothetical protein